MIPREAKMVNVQRIVMFGVKEVVVIGPTLMVTTKLEVELQSCVARDPGHIDCIDQS